MAREPKAQIERGIFKSLAALWGSIYHLQEIDASTRVIEDIFPFKEMHVWGTVDKATF